MYSLQISSGRSYKRRRATNRFMRLLELDEADTLASERPVRVSGEPVA